MRKYRRHRFIRRSSVNFLDIFLQSFFDDLYCTKVPAHRTGFAVPVPVMNLFGVSFEKGEIILSLPVEILTGLRHLCLTGKFDIPPAGKVTHMGSDFADPGTFDDIIDVRESKMLRRRDHAQKSAPEISSGTGSSSSARDMIIPRSDIVKRT